MRDANPYRCDQCQKKKGDTNHWWMRIIDVDDPRNFIIQAWNSSLETIDGVRHLCSQECVHKELAAFMNLKPDSGVPTLQSANAVEAQPANEPAEERQNKNERLFPNVTTMTN